jgi:S-DNA-T family DNA segregation ATPase FtsK/SpoIIIE
MGLEDLPHLLVAGTTGSGKSVLVSSCIIGLCCARRPDELRLLLIDPKRVEMTLYEKLPHTLTPPVVDSKKAVHALGWAIREMERRYELFAGARVRHLKAHNRKVLPKDRLPHIVIVVDELADLMMTSPKEAEDYICRLAQMARATGIHLILATQRPSVNVVTGLIKANIPARVAFTLPSQADSRTIIDLSGAEKLLGKGDMLLLTSRYPKPLRVQGPWIDESRITAFIQHVLRVFGEPQHIDIDSDESGTWGEIAANLEDPLLEEAVSIILQTGIASASRLQRQLKIGFTRAARLIDTMEQLGMVGPQEASRPREILVDEDKAEEILRQAFNGGS